MICLICRLAETTDAFTDVKLQRGEIHLVISHVPANVCPSCGEGFIDQEVARQLLQGAEQRTDTGVRNARYAYDVV